MIRFSLAFLAGLTAALLPAVSARAQDRVGPPPSYRFLTEAESQLWSEQGIHRAADHLLGQSEIREQGMTTTLRVVAILVDFPDYPADREGNPPEHYEQLLFSHGTYPGGSVADFLAASSHGRLQLEGEVRGWYTVSRKRNDYTSGVGGIGAYPANSQRLAEEAMLLANWDINFADYDNEGPDGVPDSGDDDEVVDGVVIVHAGSGREGGSTPYDFISLHWWTPAPLPVDGVFGRFFTLNPEDGGIGIFLHELGHLMGLPDLYDTDGGSFGLGAWSLMSGGLNLGEDRLPADFDAWCKVQLGFVDMTRIFVNHNHLTIPPVLESGRVYRLWADGASGDEYFLLENRQLTGIDQYLPAGGLLIYHIDERVSTNRNPNHYMVALEQADGLYQLENRFNSASFGDAGDPYMPGDEFSRYSDPHSNSYGGNSSRVSVFDIEGPAPDGTMWASIHVEPEAVVAVPSVNLVELEGNGDGLVSAGELAGVVPNIAVTERPASDMTLQVSALNGYAEVLDPQWDLGTVGAGETIELPEPIRVRVGPGLPSNPYGLPLRLTMQWEDAPKRVIDVEMGLGTIVGRSNDFEAVDHGWIPGPVRLTALNQWFYGPEYGFQNTAGFKCGLARFGYHAGVDAAVTSPPILLPPGAELVYDERFDLVLPDSTKVLACGVVEVSVNGSDWRTVEPDRGYNSYYGGSNPDWVGRRVMAGRLDDGLWHSERVDLSEFSGSIRVRFRFYSEVESRLGAGWFLDNIIVRAGTTPVTLLSAEAVALDEDVRLRWRLGEPLPAKVRWLRGTDLETAVPVADGWTEARAEGEMLDPGAAHLLPSRYWLEGRERTGEVERWGPWDVDAAPTATLPFRVLRNPARGAVDFAWGTPLPGDAVLEIFDVQGRLVTRFDLPAAPGTATWDGSDAGGRRTGPGIYFARIRNTDLPPVRLVRLP